MPAPYESKAIANFFLQRQRLTQVRLHKLVYFAHGWHLGLNRGPLLDEAIQAWRYGPVVPSLYEEFNSGQSRLTALPLASQVGAPWRRRSIPMTLSF